MSDLFNNRISGIICLVVGVAMLASIATVPLTVGQQAAVGLSTAVLFLIANRFSDRRVTLFLSILSLAMSARYIYWRATETLTFQTTLQLLLGSLLVMAEFYAVVVLVLGYIQTAWPLSRKPVPLPPEPDEWPTVDVYIPTYNESMDVVRATVLACAALDYPADKFRVYILDDGKREEFRRFAAEAGVGYLIRPNNHHAKAGNLNHAMTVTKGEFITIFDCDHIPVRAFLQLTVGWLVKEKNLAMVQTPHHFYSPDPFQRNLAAGQRVPPEGNLFYGLLQDGNDYWDATFFCGSCAVIRREALASIGGFATETVTEDAHTMLKLHRRGWNSGYLKIPLAAGLATERLILHIGQRIRWARGMMQIFRLDNPLMGPGLQLGQRLCYMNAMVHFFFGIPRLIFLISPLAYLLLFQNMIAASPFAIAAYAIPHIFHSVATASRHQRNWRHSFWSEIYETVLALFLVRVTIVTMLSPRRGKFNVTEKGGTLNQGFFDLRAVYPNIICAVVVFLGILRGVYSMIFWQTTTLEFQALLLNTIWATISLLILLAALAVGRERQQLRARARVRVDLPAIVHLGDGRVFTGTVQNLSQSGARTLVTRPEEMPEDQEVLLEIPLPSGSALIPSRYLRWNEKEMLLNFEPKTLADEAAIIQSVFGRADAWVDWTDFPKDQPLVSLWHVLQSIGGLFRRPDPVRATPQEKAQIEATIRSGLARSNMGMEQGSSTAKSATIAGAILLLLALTPFAAQAQSTIIRPLPTTSAAGNAGVPLPNIVVPNPAATTAPTQPSATGVIPQAPAASNAAAPPIAGVETETFSLKQLGANGQLALRGTSSLQGVQFGVRSDEVVINATLNLSGAMSPALLANLSNITVTLNDQYVGTIPVVQHQSNFTLSMPVNPVFFQGANSLNFRLTGAYTTQCNDLLSGLIWGTIYNNSTITLTVQHLPPQRDLAQLPLPFFDQHDNRMLMLPFVLPAQADDDTLKAAGIVASWFGQLADFRSASFPVSTTPPSGNAVMVVVGNNSSLPGLPTITGPSVSLIPNPSDPLGTLLVIAGRDGTEAVQAATSLALGYRTMGGVAVQVTPPDVPARIPYDAPAWIPTNKPVRLGQITDMHNLNGTGYDTLVQVSFRVPPDLYTWRDRGFPLNVAFRAPPAPIENLAVSRLDIGVNGLYLQSIPLAKAETGAWWRDWLPVIGATGPFHTTYIPPYDVFGANALQFFFDTRPLNRGACVAAPSDPTLGIDPNSTISLGRAYHFAEMPNLAFFVSAGFPFTRMADLSNTAVVLPDTPSTGEVSAYLRLMGRFGYWTGYPVLRVTVARPEEEASLHDDDLVVVGTIAHLGSLTDIMQNMPVSLDSGQMTLKLNDTPLGTIYQLVGGGHRADQQRAAATLASATNQDTAIVVSGRSPWAKQRTVVALLAGTPQALDTIMNGFTDPTLNPLIQGDFSILSGNQVTSYRLQSTYTVGWIPFWIWPSYLLRNQPLMIVIVMIIGCVLLTLALHATLRRRAAKRLKAMGDQQ
ncbi:UDP-forming cellulose synthase catalytic subunit [Acidisoma cellulosilytica]|uniref:Cellulose synthase catalytic subunit [UDP-forming] n=1 Tax=Acidisoma cellulosilyticum TaxID=2802395 RepID=A0A963Z6D9_9PROT|nr:UDP-forming cellulose synthase catalytic subunit [Acidisoma cellulosilyticum]MCB8883468.1 UDP-forming cellulose synthase catalytic subunit [Acidisoma cellulosilyticum]